MLIGPYLRLLLVVHGQDEVEVGLVVHLLLVGHGLFKDALDEDGRQRTGAEAAELVAAQHAVAVVVQVQVLACS